MLSRISLDHEEAKLLQFIVEFFKDNYIDEIEAIENPLHPFYGAKNSEKWKDLKEQFSNIEKEVGYAVYDTEEKTYDYED